MDKSTIVCRCEEINIDEIETAVNMGAQTFSDIKRLTRCGMGHCQAKYCMNQVNSIINNKTEIPLNELPPPRMRIPLSINRIKVLASKNDSSTTSVLENSIRKGKRSEK